VGNVIELTEHIWRQMERTTPDPRYVCCNTQVGDTSSELTIESTRDANLIANVHFRTASIAYRSFFPPESLAPTIQKLSFAWKDRLTDPTARGFAASLDGHTVGMAVVRRDPDFDPEGQLLGLHVLPEVWGRGIGSALLDRAVETLRDQLYDSAGLWTIAANKRARQMYERRGWVSVPGIELNHDGVSEVRYTRSL
jgi:GNAT superfamily N-acetyltransferase